MASGRFSKVANSNVTLHLDWESTYYESSNSSDLTVSVILEASNDLAIGELFNHKLYIDGKEYDFSSPAIKTSGNTFTIKTKTVYGIEHNPDNTKSVAISCSYRLNYIPKGETKYAGTQTWGGTATLDLPKPATLTSAQDFTDEQNPTITYNNPSGGAVGSLQACISLTGGNADIAYRNIDKVMGNGSYTFNLTEAERNVLRNATTSSKSRTVVFYVRTGIGSNYEYSKINKTFTVTNAAPSVNPTITNKTTSTVNLTGSTSKFIRYYSDASVSVGATALKGATINNHITTCGGQYFTSASGTFTEVENEEITFSVTDSRGYTTVKTVALDIVPYVKLTCNLSDNRPDTAGNMVVACSGNYWQGNFGAVQNTLTVQYRWKVQGGTFSNWTNMTVTRSGDTYTAQSQQITGLDYRTLYVFECRAADKLLTVNTGETPIKSLPVFHWSGEDVVFEVPVIFNAGTSAPTAQVDDDNEISGDFLVTGNMRLKGAGNYGNTLYFGDGSYCYIGEPSDDKMVIRATALDFTTDNLQQNGVKMFGSWTPTLNSSAVSSYTTRKGWYSRIGDSVTVGFNIKATCNSGYNSTSVSITGLPFIPTVSAAGGGMCSGAYMSAGFNFQCWVAETSGTITARVQACNNTAADNLSTSASGCFYRNNGGEITLSGTITYIAG